MSEITLEDVMAGRVTMRDLSVTPEALARQAGAARQAGRTQLAENFLRAAELVSIPESEILEIYTALRPGRTTRERLLELANDIQTKYGARRCAELLREASESFKI